jgi:hypothetical protein
LEGGQRVCLAAGPVQHQHQLATQALAEREERHQLLQLAYQLTRRAEG